MKFLNLGIGEVIFIFIIALIIFGPGNMVKTAREIGTLIRKVTKSPYWKEVWATRREINEIPKMLAKEAQLEESVKELNCSSTEIRSAVAKSMSEFFEKGEEGMKEVDKEQNNEHTGISKTADTSSEKDLKENNLYTGHE